MERAAALPTPHRRGDLLAAAVWSFAPVWTHRRALATLNAVYFGTVAIAAGFAALNPALQTALLEGVDEAFSPSGALGPLVRAYTEGQLASAIALTFAVNLLLGCVVALTLPSTIIPFAGIAIGVYRAFLWGVLFSPTPASALDESTILALPTILLEGEAYIVVMLGVWVWWSSVVRASGARWRAWKDGLLLQAPLYAAVAVILALAATCEALTVILTLS
jgi:hypothetical protein